jgi:hypothetical protein
MSEDLAPCINVLPSTQTIPFGVSMLAKLLGFVFFLHEKTKNKITEKNNNDFCINFL